MAAAETIEQIYQTHYKRFCLIACRYLHHFDEAEEAVQDGFLKALRFENQCRDGASMANWIGSIIVRECLTRLRSHRARRSTFELPMEEEKAVLASQEPSVLDDILRRERPAVVLRKLHNLSPGQRGCVIGILSGRAVVPQTGADKNLRHHAVAKLRMVIA